MTALRFSLLTAGLLALANVANAQLVPTVVQLPGEEFEHAEPALQPHPDPHFDEQPLEQPHHDDYIEIENGSAHVGDMEMNHVQDWDLIDPHMNGAHGTYEMHGDPGMHDMHAMPMQAAPCQSCKCGDEKCHGVCTDPGHPKKPKREMPGDRNRGDCPPYRYRMSDCQRAGNPHCVAKWAKCSVNEKYSSWFVGGGAPFFRGRCRKPDEGTWGLDYAGLFGHANVWMNYTRGRMQGGEGAYQTDGEPRFVKKGKELLSFGH